MELIRAGNIRRENIYNIEDIKELEKLLHITIEKIYECLIDLENGRIGVIYMFYNRSLGCVYINIQEVGILTNGILIDEIFVANEGEFGLQISASDDNYKYYEKYKLFIDEMIFEIYKLENNEKIEEPA